MNKISMSAHTPISEKNRISEIDIIRGVALFGVLLVNVVAFNFTLPAHLQGVTPLTNPLHLGSAIDRLSAVFIQLFAEGKFYTIFSFLFGLGFYIFISRAEEKGLDSRKLFKRRMLALLGFGILHLILVWYGDILHVYALGGFLLVLFRNKSERSKVRYATFDDSFSLCESLSSCHNICLAIMKLMLYNCNNTLIIFNILLVLNN
ncbi:DUF418 domain-containing protein [Natranaerobius thermophilus]|uniref:DUF418 domain-containing protein n=1 Tax=Natranaerobius thermophilus (strain ATCC BAA-1301 / DSM 18059 / JW/NM-WN-LF) TaxID=457570 RepID=B2A7D8_NATTJ|nr:hypothetical protein [Natranaerobius thermophilus]ACB84336.1 protein of unknown function DUF405 [Natranaerobius thermophilus JW/NM-WN-LF]